MDYAEARPEPASRSSWDAVVLANDFAQHALVEAAERSAGWQCCRGRLPD